MIRDRRTPEYLEPATTLQTMPTTTTLRGSLAEGTDSESIRHLASLSNSSRPQGAVLLAGVDGDPVAAMGIFDGHAVADPERSTFALRMRLQLERLFLRAVAAVAGL